MPASAGRSPVSGPTLLHALHDHARTGAGRPALTFLVNGETPGEAYTYGELAVAVSSVAAQLAQTGLARGDRALLVYPPGLAFLVAFLGCMAAGVIAVPVALPRQALGRAKLAGIAQDAGATALLSSADVLPGILEQGDLSELRPLATDQAHAGTSDLSLPAPADVAFLMYTSGSTSAPRGVAVTFANLRANHQALSAAWRCDSDSVMLSWLPLFHDMGLIGVALHALQIGAHALLTSPLTFVQKPLRWPRALSRFRATISGGPNFAFDLCARRATPEALAELDLSALKILFNGAEPIHAESLDRFAEAFAPAGFERRMLYPCYGLAEGTLFVSGGDPDAEPLVIAGDRPLVGCGSAAPGHEVVIVDPESRLPCADGTTGEIWFKGPSVASGYWGQPVATLATFDAVRADTGEGGYLRTGDLGLLQAGEVFVNGRLKDLLIVEGRNHYPQDLERTVEAAHDALRQTTAIAFSIPGRAREDLVVVVEVGRTLSPVDDERLRVAVREAVSGGHDLAIKELVLLRGQHVPKTTSGKIMRQACRQAYLDGAYMQTKEAATS